MQTVGKYLVTIDAAPDDRQKTGSRDIVPGGTRQTMTVRVVARQAREAGLPSWPVSAIEAGEDATGPQPGAEPAPEPRPTFTPGRKTWHRPAMYSPGRQRRSKCAITAQSEPAGAGLIRTDN